MKTTDTNAKRIDSYISLLKNMSARNKLDLISKLSDTLKTDLKEEKNDFYKTFGSWNKNESAEGLTTTDSQNMSRRVPGINLLSSANTGIDTANNCG